MLPYDSLGGNGTNSAILPYEAMLYLTLVRPRCYRTVRFLYIDAREQTMLAKYAITRTAHQLVPGIVYIVVWASYIKIDTLLV